MEPKNFLLEIWNLKSEILSLRILKIKAWNFDQETWSLNFLKITNLSLKVGNWECEIENLGMKILILKDTWKFWFWKILEKEDFYFIFLGWLSQLSLTEFKCGGRNFGPPLLCLFSFSFFLHLPSTSLPPLTLFTFLFPLIFLLQLTIYSHKKHSSKLLNSPSSISINISLSSIAGGSIKKVSGPSITGGSIELLFLCLCFVPRHFLDSCICRCCFSRHLYLSRITEDLYICSSRSDSHFLNLSWSIRTYSSPKHSLLHI